MIRFNYPPLRGYENDVGNNTNWMFTGASTEFQSNHYPFHRYTDYPRRNLTLILFPRSLAHLREHYEAFQRHDLPRVHFISPYFISLVNKALANYLRQSEGSRFNAKGHSHRASSGLRGIFAALLTCNHTDVYGFGASEKFGHGEFLFFCDCADAVCSKNATRQAIIIRNRRQACKSRILATITRSNDGLSPIWPKVVCAAPTFAAWKRSIAAACLLNNAMCCRLNLF